MPKGYSLNPEHANYLRSVNAKNRIWTDEHKKNVQEMLIKRNKDPKHIAKVKKALMGHGFSPETLQKMKDNHRDIHGDKNPNWRGDKVGRIGIHLWLTKNFKKKRICEFCGFQSDHPLRIDWALIKGKEYERKRKNFIELCRSCHSKYDEKGKHFKKIAEVKCGGGH